MLLFGQAWASCPPSELENGISFPGTMWTENGEGNFADFLKENQEAISEEGGLDDPEQRKTADVY